MEDRIEDLASLCHDQWSGWMEYMFSKCDPAASQALEPMLIGALTIPRWAVERWTRQMQTPYADLSEEEKETDRTEARRFIALLEE